MPYRGIILAWLLVPSRGLLSTVGMSQLVAVGSEPACGSATQAELCELVGEEDNEKAGKLEKALARGSYSCKQNQSIGDPTQSNANGLVIQEF